ncbi:MAG: hypothetical protein OYI31_06285 [Chloroflexota bacterium]|nr:hypothetical protein [Chloroflexota bacterium]MDE2942128.1 hypothetical protein [Chloroflexota bacterium]MDE3268040.1 hypothetical protein [Chloroflexota bacterium]
MSARERSSQLTRLVERIIEEKQLEKFQEYWELYEETCPVNSVAAFYLRTEARADYLGRKSGDYCNVAIIGDKLLVDIEADDSDDSGNLIVQPLRSFSDISIHIGPLRNLESSRDASLVVLANRAGDEEVGLHWVAKTEEDEDHLLEFAKVLIRVVSEK